MPEGTKRCSRCGEQKTEIEFSPAKWRRGGWCRACHKAYNRVRYEAKREEVRQWGIAYRAKNAEAIKARTKAKYWRDVEDSRAKARAYATFTNAKPERKAAKQAWARADRKKNPEKWRERSRREYARDPMARKAIILRRRAVKKQMPWGTVNAVGLQARWDFYGGLCWMCGGSAVEFDHVKPLKHGGTHCHANLRPACVPCNRRKQAIWPFQPAA